ncbi:hypothetical protein AXW83_23795 [Bosea sp. PAMC 26642]|nr:hypothetical protein AXW83_23795 [Bosea sp. PAMC 26642]
MTGAAHAARSKLLMNGLCEPFGICADLFDRHPVKGKSGAFGLQSLACFRFSILSMISSHRTAIIPRSG